MREITYRIHGAPNLALVSDLHNADPARVLRGLSDRKPSLIFVAGDVLYGSLPKDDISPLETQTNVLPFLRSCASIAPTYMSLGNHERMLDKADLQLISSTCVVVLDNSFITIKIEGNPLVLGGLTSGQVIGYRCFRDALGGTVRYPGWEVVNECREDSVEIAENVMRYAPETAWLADFAAVPGYHILLSHHPEYFPLVPESVEMVLSGHAHGGQWRIFGHGLWSPGQGFWPRWTRGVYERNRLVVSAGLNNTARIPRIMNPLEVVYVN